jgi:phosphatidylglycerophosphatase A
MTPETEASTAPLLASTRRPHISILLASWFGLGYLPKAPGTFGSAAGTALALLMAWPIWTNMQNNPKLFGAVAGKNFWTVGIFPFCGALLVTLLIAIVGVIVSTRAARYAQSKDPQWIVVDEVSGQLVAYYLFFWVLPLNWKSWLLGFILFRLFDIWKPFPARQLERLPGGWGIMADDWMAGVYAAILLRVALHFRMI